MKYIFCTFIIAALSSVSAHAQEENWDTYVAKFGEKSGSVLVDMGLAATAPDKKFPYLLVTGPKAKKCNKQGLPDPDEINSLEEVLDATSTFITGVTAKVLTGTLTYNCQRLNYYYIKDTTGIRNALARMYNRSFPNYDYVLNMKSDREWITYRTFIYPSEATQGWMENNRIISKMIADGDNLSTPRDINFDVYFKSDTGRKSFVDFARGKGYKTAMLMNAKVTNAPYEAVVSKYGNVKQLADSLSQEIKAETRMHNGYYNGWDAPKELKSQK